MKKKSTAKSAFFNLRVLIGLSIVVAGVFLALLGFGTFSAITASSAQAQQQPKIIDIDGLPPGFDCATIHEKGIDRMENFRAGRIMIACGEAEGGGSSSPAAAFSQFVQKLLPAPMAPLAYGGADVDLITGTETSPHVTQSETYTTANPDNPNEVFVAFNDSRGRNANPINISGGAFSSDGGLTFTRLTKASGQSPFDNTEGDPVILYNKSTATWLTVWIGDGQCGGGLGGYKSTTPGDPNSWTHYCVHNGASDDRESGWAENNPASPFFGRLYVSWNNFNTTCGNIGCLFSTFSTDNGATWSTPHQVSPNGVESRDVQITGDMSGNGNAVVVSLTTTRT
jgi:hypothetical protein